MIEKQKNKMLKSADFHIRGFLGNQILQSMLAYALSIENRVNPRLIFAFKDANSSLENAKTEFTKEYISILFNDNIPKKIDINSSKKTPYWFHGAAELLFKHRQRIIERFELKIAIETSEATLVHIRASDKQTESNEIIYMGLINEALRNSKTIEIIGDNPKLLKNLAKDNDRIHYQEGSSEVDDWFKLLSANKIYCSPSTFAITPALLRDVQVHILNPNDYTSYPSYLNEYTFIYEASKYFGNIHILEKISCTLTQKNSVSLPKDVLIDLLPSSHIQNEQSISQYSDYLINNLILRRHSCKVTDSFIEHINSKYPVDYHAILKEFINIFNLDKSYIPNLEKSIKSSFLTSQKDMKDVFVPPIIEEYGLSIKRHFIYTASYIIQQANSIKKQNNKLMQGICNDFMMQGYIAVENFLPTAIYNKLAKKFIEYHFSLSKNSKTLLFNQDQELMSNIFLNDNFVNFLSLLTAYESETIKKEIQMNTFCQHVKLKYPEDKKEDPQQVFHIDTFYPAFKFWYFPYKVTSKDAPFEYVKGSHLPQKQLYCHYHQRYLDNVYDKNYSVSIDNKEGSLRLTERDIDRVGLVKEKVEVPENTLVIANVGGLHRRSRHFNDVDRYSIHSSIRPRFDLQSNQT